MLLLPGSVVLSFVLQSTADISRGLDRLDRVGNVLYVAAHPDDENTRLLTWLVRDAHVRTAYLSLTRGEGGQNLIGGEQGALLGGIREQELHAARSIDGAEQIFAGLPDFGYSKSPDETLKIWNKQKALKDVVFAIRRFKPDLILTRFAPDGKDTHGHHTASAQLALEAFTAAADPKVMPELPTWKAQRIVWNKGIWGTPKPEDIAGFVQLDVSGFDPVLGLSYGETAARARSMHKSQGFGSLPQRGPQNEYFKVLAGPAITTSPLDGLDFSWTRVKGGETVHEAIVKARAALTLSDPAFEALLDVCSAIEALPDNPWKQQKLDEARALALSASGVFFDATIDDANIVQGAKTKVTVTALSQRLGGLTLRSVRVGGAEAKPMKPLERGAPIETVIEFAAGMGPMNAEIEIVHSKRAIVFTRRVTFAKADPVQGEVRRPLAYVPAVTVRPKQPLLVFSDGAAKSVEIVLRASRGAVSGRVSPDAGVGFDVKPASAPFSLAAAGAEQTLSFIVTPPKHTLSAGLGFSIDGQVAKRVQSVDYPHIPRVTIVDDARAKLVRIDLKKDGTRVGYVNGAGDDVAEALRQAGYSVSVVEDFTALDRYDAIVFGVRAFNVRPDLVKVLPALHAWVEQGGTLLVQYNTNSRLAPLTAEIGPKPFVISQERVTDETAAMTLADDPIWRTPNVIAAADFAGWVQERGLYFAGTFDPAYRTPLSCNDPAEPARLGGLLVLRHGKGRFVYTGLAFFRQLPAGVPGAFRLFANLIAHGE